MTNNKYLNTKYKVMAASAISAFIIAAGIITFLNYSPSATKKEWSIKQYNLYNRLEYSSRQRTQMECLINSAKAGFPKAEFALGQIYRKGLKPENYNNNGYTVKNNPFTPNCLKAEHWYELASKHGNMDASIALKNLKKNIKQLKALTNNNANIVTAYNQYYIIESSNKSYMGNKYKTTLELSKDFMNKEGLFKKDKEKAKKWFIQAFREYNRQG